jgi:hypothetical protein
MNCPECGKPARNKTSNTRPNQWQCKNPECDVNYFRGNFTLKNNKRKGIFDWREWSKFNQEHQNLRHKASFSQDSVTNKIKTKEDNIIFLPMSDLHLGAYGTDYKLFEELTELILNDDRIFIGLFGDETDNFVNFRNKLAMHQQILTPEEQDAFLESWIKEIRHKILWASWGNHGEFEEANTGKNNLKRILNQYAPYFNGMGVASVKLNKIEYTFAVTHKTRWWSSMNPLHGLCKMSREQIQGKDIYIAGDRHTPAFGKFFESGRFFACVQCGTLKVNDGYAKRYFSYYTSPAMPPVVLNTKEKIFTPVATIQEALKLIDGA